MKILNFLTGFACLQACVAAPGFRRFQQFGLVGRQDTPSEAANGAEGIDTIEPASAEPVSAEPVLEEPIPEETRPGEPISEKPIIEGPIPEEPTPEKHISDEPIIEEAMLEEPVPEEPVPEEPVSEEPVQVESVPEKPISEESASEEPVSENASSENFPESTLLPASDPEEQRLKAAGASTVVVEPLPATSPDSEIPPEAKSIPETANVPAPVPEDEDFSPPDTPSTAGEPIDTPTAQPPLAEAPPITRTVLPLPVSPPPGLTGTPLSINAFTSRSATPIPLPPPGSLTPAGSVPAAQAGGPTETLFTVVTPSPGAIPIAITRQGQWVTSYVPQVTICPLSLQANASASSVRSTSLPSTLPDERGEGEPAPEGIDKRQALALSSPNSLTNLTGPATAPSLYTNTFTPTPSGPCTTLYSSTYTPICYTTLQPLGQPGITVTDCTQDITFSTDHGVATDDKGLQTTLYHAPYSSVLSGLPSTVTKDVCSPRGCQTYVESWSSRIVQETATRTSSVSVSQVVTGPAVAIISPFATTTISGSSVATIDLETAYIVTRATGRIVIVPSTISTVASGATPAVQLAAFADGPSPGENQTSTPGEDTDSNKEDNDADAASVDSNHQPVEATDEGLEPLQALEQPFAEDPIGEAMFLTYTNTQSTTIIIDPIPAPTDPAPDNPSEGEQQGTNNRVAAAAAAADADAELDAQLANLQSSGAVVPAGAEVAGEEGNAEDPSTEHEVDRIGWMRIADVDAGAQVDSAVPERDEVAVQGEAGVPFNSIEGEPVTTADSWPFPAQAGAGSGDAPSAG